ncbi:MAG TPA: S46 family peptidase [Paludibacteraceae bacterium]|nr:S46 family peptidase [Paludibacteraceae bacterium]
MKKISVLLLSLTLFLSVKADEGMWMLPLIEKLNIQKMHGLGLTMTAEEIYSDKNVSLKDAVVIFGGGCTGVMVSPEGLVFTNHHCGYDAIQKHSSVEHNYLKDGFTAKELKDEIPSPGLAVTFLVKVEDVTDRVLPQIDNLNGKKRNEVQDSICKAISNEATQGTHYTAQVKPFYSGNEFYLFVYEKFTDVRFAYAPPSSIGKFGGETDNWMYPRHTGDFSVFRVYCAPDGKPADYSKDNVPYSPKRFVTISNQGYQPGDYTMILGNPGSTERYLSSWGINERVNNGNKARIEIRGAKQDVWKKYMLANEAINIAYAGKYARSSNYWKNSIGMNSAIEKLKVVAQKQKQEKEFDEWVKADPQRVKKYGTVLKDLEDGYNTIFPYSHALSYLSESLLSGVELPRMASMVKRGIKNNDSSEKILKKAEEFYKDYYPEVDQATFAVLLDAYKKSVTPDALPEIYNTIDKKFKGDYAKYAAYLFDKSVFVSPSKLSAALNKKNYNFEKDPAVIFFNDVLKTMNSLNSKDYVSAVEKIDDAERLYEAGLKEIAAENNTARYPNANFTMRLTYGQVGRYNPADAATYDYFTTTRGILEKENPNDPEFVVPEKLKSAILAKDFGQYVDAKTGEMHVAFISNNDITGGNSGSPVFNAKGELIGLAFDGNWEALSGDIVFEPNMQRTISVDIRYVLFIMEKVGGADRLIKELTIK